MSQPDAYVITTSFTEHFAADPAALFPGDKLDVEFLAIQHTLEEVLTNLAMIQRDDGLLVNGLVTPDALSAATLDLLALATAGVTVGTANWATATSYPALRVLTYSAGGSTDGTYLSTTAHTSGTFATDLAAGKWVLLALKNVPGVPVAVAEGGTGATNAASARTNLGLGSAALLSSAALLLSASNLSDVADAATARSNLGVVNFDITGQTELTATLADSDEFVVYDTSASAFRKVTALPLAQPRNLLINGAASIWQLGTGSTSRADDVYGLDGWYVLTQTGAVNVSRVDNPFNGARYCARITQAQASAQRFGFAQIVETVDSVPARGRKVNLKAALRCSATTKIRFALCEWTGTADTVTSDVVNDWTSGTYTAGNFFLGSNLTITGTGSVDVTANVWADITPLIATLGSSGNNLVVIFWTDSTQAQNVTLDFANVDLQLGGTPAPFAPAPFQVELDRCQRFYEKTFALETAPQDGVGSGTANELRSTSITGVFDPIVNWRFKVEKRTSPTVTLYCPRSGGSSGQWSTGSAELANARALGANSSGVIIDNNGTTPGANAVYLINAVADARL